MAERKRIEKDTLIKILDCCIEDDCVHCPNAYKDSSIAACEAVARGSVHIPFAIMREIINALKEQEAKPVKNEQIRRLVSPWVKSADCPNCGKPLIYETNKYFCGLCGQKVKWDD